MNFDPSHINAPPGYRQKIARCLSRRDKLNAFWEKFIEPSLILEDLGVFTALPADRAGDHSHVSTIEFQRKRDSGQVDQSELVFFTPAYRFPAFGPKLDSWTTERSSTWQAPSDRTGLGYFWPFTLEYDPDGPDGFAEQLRWFYEKGDNGNTLLEDFDVFLRQSFKDYRGYSVVWSGNKSFHIHLLFDTTHLSLAVLESWCRASGKNPESKRRDHYQHEDLSDHALKGYYSAKWQEIVEIFQNQTDILVPFDPRLAQLHQKRRIPWGTRLAGAGNLHGFPEGAEIPQIVVAERIITSAAKGSRKHFLTAAEGNQYIRPPTKRHRGTRAVTQNAPNGCWYMDVYDQDSPEKPVVSAWFTRQGNEVQCEFLEVELAYRGQGIPRHLCDLASVLWGAEIRDIENVVDDMKNIGYQFYAEDFPSDLLDANQIHEA